MQSEGQARFTPLSDRYWREADIRSLGAVAFPYDVMKAKILAFKTGCCCAPDFCARAAPLRLRIQLVCVVYFQLVFAEETQLVYAILDFAHRSDHPGTSL